MHHLTIMGVLSFSLEVLHYELFLFLLFRVIAILLGKAFSNHELYSLLVSLKETVVTISV